MNEQVIEHSRPTMGAAEQQAAAEVITSGRLAAGEQCRLLEQALAGAMGVRHGAAVSSGLAALHVATLAAGVGEGDQVILPTYTCEALLNAVLYCKGQPVIVDVDDRTGNVDPQAARRALTGRTKLIIVPHTFGTPAPMDDLLRLDVPVLEDCATSIGARLGGRPVGSMGQAAVVSLYATKMLCAGEGGAVCSDDAAYIEKVADVRDYRGHEDYSLRFNYMLSDLAAAVGRVQVARLGEFVRRRRELAALYDGLLADVEEVERPELSAGDERSFYRYVVKVAAGDRDRLRAAMKKQGVNCGLGVLHPLHRLMPSAAPEPCPAGEEWSRRTLSLPIYPLLTDVQARRVVQVLKESL